MLRRAVVLLTLVALGGCVYEEAPKPALTRTVLQERSVTVQGRLQRAVRQGQSANVSVFEIQSDGRLAAVANAAIATDQFGHYVVNVRVPEGADLLVRADDASGFGLVVVPTDLQVDKRVPARPINDETTVEAQVYLAAKATATWPPELGISRLHGLISAPLARLVLQDRQYSSAVGILGRAAAAAAQSWAAVLGQDGSGAQAEQLKATYAALDWSHYTLAAGLNSADSVQAEQDALSDFEAGVPLVYGLANIRPAQLALAAQGSAVALETYGHLLKGAAQAQAEGDAEMLRASYVVELVNETGYENFALPTRQALKTQGEALLLRISNAHGTPSAVRKALASAWVDYRDEVVKTLRPGAAQLGLDWPRTEQAVGAMVAETLQTLQHLDAAQAPAEMASKIGDSLTALQAAAKTQAAGEPRVLGVLCALANLDMAAQL